MTAGVIWSMTRLSAEKLPEIQRFRAVYYFRVRILPLTETITPPSEICSEQVRRAFCSAMVRLHQQETFMRTSVTRRIRM